MRRQLVTRGKRTKTSFNFRRQLRNLRRAFTDHFAQFPVVFLLAYPAANCLNEGQVRRGRLIFVTCAAQHHSAIERGLNNHFARESRLARARLTAQQETVTAAFLRPAPKLARFRQLSAARNQTAARESVEKGNRTPGFLFKRLCRLRHCVAQRGRRFGSRRKTLCRIFRQEPENNSLNRTWQIRSQHARLRLLFSGSRS